MRLAYLTAGLAVLVAAGVWQVQADRADTAKDKKGPVTAALIKHGDYLVNRVALCSDCHTPRDAKGNFDRSKLLQGATLGVVPKKKTEGWMDKAPDITASGLAGEWKEE